MNLWPTAKQSIVERLQDALHSLPGVEVCNRRLATPPEDIQGTGVFDIAVGGHKFSLALEIRRSVYPRDVRQVLEQMRNYRTQYANRLPVLAAEAISPGAKELLQTEKVGYWDSGGSLFLSAPGLHILIERPPPKSLKRTMRTLFSGRRAQAILAILNSHEQWLGVAEVARKSGVSRSTVSQVMTELVRQGFMDSRGAGPSKERRVASPGELLDSWVTELPTLRKTLTRRFFVPGCKPGQLAAGISRKLEERGVSGGLTGQAAAQRYAPLISSISVVTVRVLQYPAVEAAIAELGGHEVDEGANLEILPTRWEDEFQFREKAGEVWLLSPIQVYLDLLQSKGRSQELADHLRRERIGF